MLLAIVFALVFAVARLVGGGSEEDPGASARPAAGDASRRSTPTHSAQAADASASATPTATPTAVKPAGPCADGEVLITAAVPTPVAGQDIPIVLNLQSSETGACTFSFSAESVTMNITSGADEIWLSKECPKVLPTRDVVVRRAAPTPVQVVWNARRSDEGCTGRTAWALPGYYHVTTAALGSEPTDVRFELTAPTAAPATPTATPKAPAKPTAKASPSATAKPAPKKPAAKSPSAKPSGAVEPDQLSSE